MRYLFAALAAIALSTLAEAAVPEVMSYQGVLRDAQGDLVADGSYNITFGLYNVPTGGSALWTETLPVTTSNGVFNTVLGNTSSLSGVSFHQQLYMGMAIDGGSELTPRTQLTASPYSLASLGPRMATLRDVKSAGTHGGTFTSGAWQTRNLNVLEDPDGIGVVLASDEFTLPPGTYYIEAFAPAVLVDSHQARLRNITDGTTTVVGTMERVNTQDSVPVQTWSKLYGQFTISATTTFQIQHICQTTKSTWGFGYGPTNLWNDVDTAYTTVKITQLR